MNIRKVSGAEALSLVFPFLLGGAMFALTISATIGIVSRMLPPDAQGRAWFAVFALEGGLIIWPAMFRYACHGPLAVFQKILAAVMSLICFGGVTAAFIIETHYQAAKSGVAGGLDKGTSDIAVWIIDVVILLTIVAAITHHQLSPKQGDNYQPAGQPAPRPTQAYAPPPAPPMPAPQFQPPAPMPMPTVREVQTDRLPPAGNAPTRPAQPTQQQQVRPSLPRPNFTGGGKFEQQGQTAPKLSPKPKAKQQPQPPTRATQIPIRNRGEIISEQGQGGEQG